MSTKLAALGLAAVVAAAGVAGTASAQDANGFYLRGIGGASFPENTTNRLDVGGTGIGDAKLDYRDGYILGAAAGYDLQPNSSVELEYAYRRADVKDSDNARSNAVMANYVYRFTPLGQTGAWEPYLGLGIGWADFQVRDDAGNRFSADNSFAYQVFGGVGYRVSENVTLDGQLRWFSTDKNDLDGPADSRLRDADFQSVDVLAGVTYHF